jgi:hypothetical protein
MPKQSKTTKPLKMTTVTRDSKRDGKALTVTRKQQRALKQARRTGKLEIR